MAIKGKGKARSRRVIAAPPRPQLVVRKKPVWRRRWVWAVMGLAAAGGITTGVLLNIKSNNAKELKSREISAVEAFDEAVVGHLPPGSAPLGQGSYNVFPTLSTDLSSFAAGKLPTKDATKKADTIIAQAKATVSKIQAIDVTKVIPEDSEVTFPATARGKGATRDYLINVQFLMTQAFGLYQDAAELMKQAVSLTGDGREALITQAQDVANRAATLWGRAESQITSIKSVLGIQPQGGFQPPLPPGIPTP
jgi:hypothetical protein